jgi:hypothetical protein
MVARTEDIDEGRDIEQALVVWRPRTSKALSAEDARVIIRNVTGFFGILAQWEAVERIAANSPPAVQGDQANEQW